MKPKIKEYNSQTQEEIIRDATDAEMAQMEKTISESEARKAEAEAKTTAKTALLNKLGITAEEAILLLS